MTLEKTPLAEAHALARKVADVGGCVPAGAIPMLTRIFQEISDLREKLRISEENRKLLAVEAFVKAGEDNG